MDKQTNNKIEELLDEAQENCQISAKKDEREINKQEQRKKSTPMCNRSTNYTFQAAV